MENNIEIKRIDIKKYGKEWNDAISSFQQSTFFHTSYWLNIIEGSFNLKSNHILLEFSDKHLLIMPLFISKNAFHSPFVADYGGVCINEEFTNDIPVVKKALKSLFRELEGIGKEKGKLVIYVRGYYNNKAQEEFLNQAGFKRISDHLTYILSDFYNVEDTLSIFHKKTRNAVRKALKDDIMIEHISSDSKVMDDYYKLHVMTKEKHGSEPYPKKFFDLLPTIPPKNIDLWIAKYNDMCIAGIMAFVHDKKMHIFDNCSDPRFLKLNPNNLLYYTLIEKAKENRMEIDFGRTSPGDKNLRQFKERWGGKMHTFGTYRKIIPPVILNTFRFAFGSIRERGFKNTLNRAMQRG